MPKSNVPIIKMPTWLNLSLHLFTVHNYRSTITWMDCVDVCNIVPMKERISDQLWAGYKLATNANVENVEIVRCISSEQNMGRANVSDCSAHVKQLLDAFERKEHKG